MFNNKKEVEIDIEKPIQVFLKFGFTSILL